MNDLTEEDLKLALEQALDLLQRAVDGKDDWRWIQEAEYFLNQYRSGK
jgi:hypothetical protein